MNFVKRAYLYTTRKKVRTILLFSIILIMATLLIVCFSINPFSNVFAFTVKPHFKALLTFEFAISDEEFIEKQTISKVAIIRIIENNNIVLTFFLVVYKYALFTKFTINHLNSFEIKFVLVFYSL